MKKILGKRILAVFLAVFMVFTVLPTAVFAFDVNNYKASITKVSVGTPTRDINTGKRYLPVTVTFTATENLGDKNAVMFLVELLRLQSPSSRKMVLVL